MDLRSRTSAALCAPSLPKCRNDQVKRILWTHPCQVVSLLVFPSAAIHGLCGREAVQLGYAKACTKCTRQPQVVGVLCFGCNGSAGRLARPQHRGTSPNQVCRTPRCSVPVCIRPNGVACKYCSDTHKEYVPHSSLLARRVCTKGCGGWENAAAYSVAGP